MFDQEDFLAWRIPINWDPIGPWLRDALKQELIDGSAAKQLTVTQIQLQREAVQLQSQLLDLQAKALDAIGKAVGGAKQ